MRKSTPPKGSKFVYVTYINTTPQKLWAALTTTEFIRQYWMGRENTSTWRPGAPLESRSPEGELEWHGKILRSERPRLLIYTFQVVGRSEPVTKVTFEIEKLDRKSIHFGEGLKLTVTHEGYAPESGNYKGISAGWPAILSGLKSLLETGRSLELRYQRS